MPCTHAMHLRHAHATRSHAHAHAHAMRTPCARPSLHHRRQAGRAGGRRGRRGLHARMGARAERHVPHTKRTRTPRRLRRVRTGYAYPPPAWCTYRRRRAACPQGPACCSYCEGARTRLGRSVRTAYCGTPGRTSTPSRTPRCATACTRAEQGARASAHRHRRSPRLRRRRHLRRRRRPPASRTARALRLAAGRQPAELLVRPPSCDVCLSADLLPSVSLRETKKLWASTRRCPPTHATGAP